MEVLGVRTGPFSVAALLLLVMAFPMRADSVTENKVKAAFIINFVRFIKWPPESLSSAGEPFTICTETSAALEDALRETVQAKSLDGHVFVVHPLRHQTDVHACQLVFFSGAASVKSAGLGILTIADDNATPAASQASAITFVLDNNRIRFSINNGAAEHAGLTISSKLLALATKVDR